MKLTEISNNGSLTPAQIKWLDKVIDGTYEVVDGKINVKGHVNIPRETKSLPVQFSKVTGYFNCSYTQITSLKGSPSEVGGLFYCNNTQITSLEGSPSKVGEYFNCATTKITSLEACPSEVGKGFYCNDTNITSLIGVADSITQINGEIFTYWYEIESGGLGLILIDGLKELRSIGRLPNPFEIISKYLGRPDQLFDCQQELIENGFEEWAIL